MKKGYKKLLLISLSLIALLILNIIFNILDKKLYILFLFASFFSIVLLIGIEDDKFIYKKDLILLITISCLFYFIITYAMGLYTGFIRNGYKLTFINIMKNIIPLFLIIILEELIRYNLVKKGSRNISIIVIVLVIAILMDITLIIKGFDLKNGYLLVEFLLSWLLVSLFKNFFLTYATYKGGYKISVIYRMILESYLYFMPLFPKLNIYVDTILKILFSTLMIILIYVITKNNESQIHNKKYNVKKSFHIILIILIAFTICLNSGYFKFYTLTIGSGSMTPNINKGDVVIIEKIQKKDLAKLKIGNVLVFNKGNKIIVHRIIDIKNINNSYQIYTKGDANAETDRWINEEKDIIGIVKYRIMFIGYPTVWLSEILNNN